MLVSNLAVGAAAVLVLTSKPMTRQLALSNFGPGTLFYETGPRGYTPTLTTANGKAVSGENPNIVVLTPGLDTSTGFDLYAISGSTTTMSAQTLPL